MVGFKVADLPSQPLLGDSSDLIDLHPALLRETNVLRKGAIEGKPCTRLLAGQGKDDHRPGIPIENIVADHQDRAMT